MGGDKEFRIDSFGDVRRERAGATLFERGGDWIIDVYAKSEVIGPEKWRHTAFWIRRMSPHRKS